MTEAKQKIAQYVFYFALEIAGMALILWDGLPIYRHLFVHQRIGTTADEAIMFMATVAIQVSYWRMLRHPPPFTFMRRPFVAHVLLFMSRLIFIFASSLFALVVYRNPEEISFNPLKLTLFFAVLFSVFCFTRHLEALGNLFLRGSEKPAGG